jgi:flagellar motor protein MotB
LVPEGAKKVISEIATALRYVRNQIIIEGHIDGKVSPVNAT